MLLVWDLLKFQLSLGILQFLKHHLAAFARLQLLICAPDEFGPMEQNVDGYAYFIFAIGCIPI